MTSRHSISEFGEAYDDDRELQQAVFDDELGSIPRRPLVEIDVETTVSATIQIMNERNIGCVVVTRAGKLAGIFTERDVLTKVAGVNLDPQSTPVSQLMTSDPQTLPHNASIAFALHQMDVEGYRHLPLVDDAGKPVGVVAMRDIISWMVELFPASLLNLPPHTRFPTSVDGG